MDLLASSAPGQFPKARRTELIQPDRNEAAVSDLDQDMGEAGLRAPAWAVAKHRGNA